MDNSTHKILMDLAWDLKDVICKLNALKATSSALTDADRDRLQEASEGIERIIDLLGQK